MLTAVEQAEQVAMRQIEGMFPTIDAWLARTSGPMEVQANSRVAVVDAASHPYCLSHAVVRSLGNATDHLHALRTLIGDARTLHTYAPFTLCRVAVENAAAAIWLLSPEDDQERLRRHLVECLRNLKHSGEVEELAQISARKSLADRQQDVVALATAAGFSEKLIRARPIGQARIVREGGEVALGEGPVDRGGRLAEVVWRAGSGIAHGQLWSSLAVLEREEVGGTRDALQLKVTAGNATLLHHMFTAWVMLKKAFWLYDHERVEWKQHPKRSGEP